ncbi:hydrophobe/amphiphile efflux-1 family RND transporter [Aphanothece hegewaldii CCALA 016]|uniref:Hydrophobe/amphiphile efflux-1 family RND transporter n=1 Tax=Aphanothece hegewaldii CCALA 016 TaxID=2107694 RepID=A0A2T1LUB6_9CHRO|nr:efflux RND transporter permease subunit [Aphanothece hegewaldii]PSF35000.1 hydrophobe/amphiphile efflux-1 family RND transporter [Aphanothece hegewaldii CCALA 016]
MSVSDKFIRSPVLTTVCSLFILLLGGIALPLLPLEKLPQLAPTQIQVTSTNIGADARTTVDTVTDVLESEINGVEDMKYMTSNTASDGISNITVSFPVAVNRNIAQVNVQNRVNQALPNLPDVVKQTGVTTEAASPSLLLAYGFYSEKNEEGNYLYDTQFISNYLDLFVVDELKRIPGIGSLVIIGERKYAMRIWLDPAKLASRNLTPSDVERALREQNIQTGAGRIGQEPTNSNQSFSIPLKAESRFTTVEDGENLVIQAQDNGQLTKVKDVGWVELGAENYDVTANISGKPTAGIALYQLPGANALDTGNRIKAKIEELSANFPPGLKYEIPYDSTLFVVTSLRDVTSNLLQAIVMAILTILLFLQDWRSTIVPALAMPVAMIGAMSVLLGFGFSINQLTMFGIILAIGTVTDDAVVIVEAIKSKMNQGMRPRQAAVDAMNELATPSITAALVQLAVFIPVCFFPGTTGIVYRQFAITLSAAIVFSTFNALTFSPTIAALFLKPAGAEPGLIDQLVNFLFGWLFNLFNRGFGWIVRQYSHLIEVLVKMRYLVLGFFVAGLIATILMLKIVPTGFIPEEDQGLMILLGEAPASVSLNYSEEQVALVSKILDEYPEIESYLGAAGFGLEGNAYNKYLFFIRLKSWADRTSEEQSVFGLLNTLNQRLRNEITGSKAFLTNVPPVDGVGATGGFEFQLQNRAGLPSDVLLQNVNAMIAAANQRPELQRVTTTFTPGVSQMAIRLNREIAKAMNVDINEAFGTLQSYLGGRYVNDFILNNKQYRVYVQADGAFRDNPEKIKSFYVRSKTGSLVQLNNLIEIEEFDSPPIITRYNVYEAVKIQGTPAPGYSSGQAIAAMEEVAAQVLNPGFGYEWTGLSLEEKSAGGATGAIFALAFILVFLIMAAQYGSYIDPTIILLTVPLAALGAMVAIWFRANLLQVGSIWPVINNDIYAQVGLLMLIGMASKNAILIVEQANEFLRQGMSLSKAAIASAKSRFLPIVMTASSGLVGYIPLMTAAGAGAISRWSIGTVSFGGYLVATILSLGVAPVLYIVVKSLERQIISGKREV